MAAAAIAVLHAELRGTDGICGPPASVVEADETGCGSGGFESLKFLVL